MQKKAKIVVFSFTFLVFTLVVELIYLKTVKITSQDQITIKQEFVSFTKLPDLAISTEATFIRHRSLSSVFDIYKNDGTLRGYFPSSFVISDSKRVVVE